MRGRELIERLHDEIVVGDGAMGTMLQARGIPWNANFDLLNLLLMLAPAAPHITEELREMMGHEGSIAGVSWPSYDPALTSEEELTIVIQVNGKLRSRITVSADESEEKIKEMALADEKTQKFLEGVKVVKVITVPKKLVNIVVK
jgi:leucyl-tRNA synthetase